MKKILIRSCLTVALALCAQAAMADCLYFLVGDGSGNSPTYNGEEVIYTYATVKMISADGSGGSSYLDLYEGGATVSSGKAMMAGSTSPAYAELPNNYDDFSKFLFELWDADANRVGWQGVSLGDARSGGHIVDSSAYGTALYVSEVIPEPTGGVLVLLGMAVLAMRRKTRMI